MKNQWQLLKDVKEKGLDEIEASADVPTDSLWFSGHFPGEPILPGVALVHLAEQAIVRLALEKGEDIQLSGLKKVRFTQPVRPGEKLSVMIQSSGESAEIFYSFKIICQEKVVCSGLIVAKRGKKP